MNLGTLLGTTDSADVTDFVIDHRKVTKGSVSPPVITARTQKRSSR
jgi:hypothetical protein